jgi:hypothetical protein
LENNIAMEKGRIPNNNTIMEKVEGNKHQKMIVATTSYSYTYTIF